MAKIITFRTRWPFRQIADIAPLNPAFVKAQNLSEAEIEEAEYKVLQSIAIIRP